MEIYGNHWKSLEIYGIFDTKKMTPLGIHGHRPSPRRRVFAFRVSRRSARRHPNLGDAVKQTVF